MDHKEHKGMESVRDHNVHPPPRPPPGLGSTIPHPFQKRAFNNSWKSLKLRGGGVSSVYFLTSVSDPEIEIFPSSVSAFSRILENSSSDTAARDSRLSFRLYLE